MKQIRAPLHECTRICRWID